MPTRRCFLIAAAAAAVVRPVLAAEAKGERPLPELVPDRDLPVVRLDVVASMARRTLVLTGGRDFTAFPQGLIVDIPGGTAIPLPWWEFNARANSGFAPGARIVLRGGGTGPRPRLFAPGDEGLLRFNNFASQPIGFEIDNLHLVSGTGGAALHAAMPRFVRVSNSLIEGGRNGLFIPPHPTVALVEDSTIARGGQGDGYTHSVYVNYIEAFTARRSTFKAARAQGHAFKCYAARLLMRDCVVAAWETTGERDAGFHGLLPPVDIGAWAHTTLVGNTFIRRGPTRPTCLEYRNRQYARDVSKDIRPGWGTTVVDHRLVDNRDPANPHLFHHFLVGNRFVNGVLPDGGVDEQVRRNPGIAIRANGTGAWASQGDVAPGHGIRPADYQPWNERAVVWAVGNRFDGVRFEREFDEAPFGNAGDRAPIHRLDRLPPWARIGA